MASQKLWSLVEGDDTGELDVEHVHLPGVRCPECGNTWAYFGRQPIDLSPEQETIIRKTKAVLSPEKFKDLLERLQLGDGRRPLPGTKLGRPKIKRVRQKSLGGCYFSFSFELFIAAAWEPIFHDALRGGAALIPAYPPRDNYLELIPAVLDPLEFGAPRLCEGCGRCDPEPALPRMIEFLQSGDGPHITLIPGAKVITEELRAKLQNVGFQAISFQEYQTKK